MSGAIALKTVGYIRGKKNHAHINDVHQPMAIDATSSGSEKTSLESTAYFGEVSDPRIQRWKEHTLLDIIGLTICAVFAVDGKTSRGSYDRESSKAALQMIDVWSCEQELVLGQEAVPEETNETGALPELLRLLELEGAIVTIDAAGCYPSVTETLFEKLEAIGRLPEPCKRVDSGHDRVEIRRCWALIVEKTLVDGADWEGLSSVCKVQAERHHPDGTVEIEGRLFISSLKADPKRLLKAVRHHWHVENKLHWTVVSQDIV
jgi:predicted transposase YbfD/YdcC